MTRWWAPLGLAAMFALVLVWGITRGLGLTWSHGGESPTLATPASARGAAEQASAPAASGLPPETASAATEAEWLAGNSSDWRAGRIVGLPGVLIIEFPSLASQGRAMNRIASLLEKDGAPRDRVLDDGDLQALIQSSGDSAESFYQGHDYRASGLASFFTLARSQRVQLDAEEERLLLLLLQRQVLRETGSGWIAMADQALVTFTATQAQGGNDRDDEVIDPVRRRSILEHELSHGRYFTDVRYRDACLRFWRTAMSERQRMHMKHFLAGLHYNAQDEDLMINETQALLFHTPDSRAFNAAAVSFTQEELDGLRSRFLDASH